jgi:hypothetical protein
MHWTNTPDGEQKYKAARAREKALLTTLIVAHVKKEPDPAMWLVIVRGLVEMADMKPERCIILPASLNTLAWNVADEAIKQGDRFVRALADACREAT